jgi:transposase-like protein
MNQSRRLAREKWRQLVDAQLVGGMTVAAYCREHQVTEGAFFAWKRRLRESAKPEGSPVAGFVEVKARRDSARVSMTGGAEVESSAIEIYLQSNRRLLVRRGFDRGLLTELIHVLEAL